jgi:hypothetical protein
MTQRKWIILGALLLLLTIGAEFVVRPWNSSRGCVQVLNQGDSAMDELSLTYGETKVTVGTLKAGQSTKVWFTGAGKAALDLSFKQPGNAINGFQVQQFDPADYAGNESKLVLVVKNNRVERFTDEEEATTPIQRLKATVSAWWETELRPIR